MSYPVVTTKPNNLRYDVSADQWNGVVQAVGNQPYSYLIYTETVGGVPTYYAKNGKTGLIDFTSTTAATTIQAVFDTIPGATYASKTSIVYFQSGNYSLGSTGLTISTYSRDFSLEFSPNAVLIYTGTGYALTIYNAERFSIVNPNIYAPSGGAIQLGDGAGHGASHWTITPTYINAKGGIYVATGNEGSIIGGKLISPSVQLSGSVGIALGGTSTTDTWADTITIDRTTVNQFKIGIQLGVSTLTGKAPETITIHAGIYDNDVGILAYAARNVEVSGCSFENSAYAGTNYIQITNDNTGSYDVPREINIHENRFHQQTGDTHAFCLYISDYCYYLKFQNNFLSVTDMSVSAHTMYGEIDVTEFVGAITANSLWTTHFYSLRNNYGIVTVYSGNTSVTVALAEALPNTFYDVNINTNWAASGLYYTKTISNFTVYFADPLGTKQIEYTIQ
jgi:hypothetical protein